MAVNVPDTQWRPPTGNSEMGNDGEALLTTLSGAHLVTLSGNFLTTLQGTNSPQPATAWVSLEPTPATQWQDAFDSDFDNTGDNNIVDTADVFLVDPSGDFIVDTGVTRTEVPATDWEEDDSI